MFARAEGPLSFPDSDVAFLGDAANGATDEVAGAPPQASPDASTGGGQDDGGARFSETTTQEVGVDEADVVKTDGENLFILDSQTLRIVSLESADGLSLAGEITLEGFGREMFLHGDTVVALTETHGGFFYALDGPVAVSVDAIGDAVDESLAVDISSSTADVEPGQDAPPAVDEPGDDSELIVVDQEQPPVEAGDVDIAPQFSRPQTIVTLIDVADPTSPTVISQTKLDGTSVSSRMIDGVLHLVVANYQAYYFDVLPQLGRAEFAAPQVDVETILPQFSRVEDGEVVASGALLSWEEMYRPTDPDGFGVVTVASMDIEQRGEISAKGIVAEPGLVYSSLQALYLTDTNYDFRGNARETTDIYKFEYVGGETVPTATGTVRGRVLNQYSMGEYQGNLRVATTVRATFSDFGGQSGPFNNVYVLHPTEDALEVMGSIENIAERETIQSARFAGDRGYLVTFEQIDPLFTLDLADPANPTIVGELKVPGFSTYLVPMDQDHVLAVGQYIPENGFFFGQGVQLSIFDVSDFANPQLAHTVVIGEGGSAWSEALHNPKAFTYFAEEGLVALPITIYEAFEFFDDIDFVVDELSAEEDASSGETGSDPQPDDLDEPISIEPTEPLEPTEPAEPIEPIAVPEPYINGGFDGLIVYRVSVDGGFEELGRLSTRFEDAGIRWGGSFTRGVFVEDDVLAVTNFGVKAASIANPAQPIQELLLYNPTVTPIEADSSIDVR